MKKNSLLILLGFIFIFLLAFILPDYFLPTDVLNNLPSFSLNGWERPKNSLLADPVYQFEPWRYYAKEQLLKGRFPLWNDQNGNGAPFFANPQTAVLYPLNFFYYIFPQNSALYLIPFLKLYLFGIFSYLYLRTLKISKEVSLLGSTAAIFSGFPIVWLLWPHTNVFILFPLILFITEKIHSSTKYRHRWYLLLSLTYFFAILGGHPETLFLLGLIHFLYIIVRFWGKIKTILSLLLSVIFGFLLGSIQLIPFLEYLLNSYVLQQRSIQSIDYFLPFKSMIFNIFPFLLGAPQLDFYKPISNFTNFQEDIGGYVGLAVFSLAILGAIKWRKIFEFKLWIFIVLISLLISYNIWPLSLISNLPIFNASANHRLIGFISFGLVVLFSLSLNKINEVKINFSKYKKIFLFSSVFIIITFLTSNMVLNRITGFSSKILVFSKFLSWHIFFILMTTIIFYLLLIWIIGKKSKYSKFILVFLVPILFQTIFLFWNYNPTLPKNNYYPETNLIKKLQGFPKGNILEVGNPSIPANINLIYNLSQIQNNDAMEIENYRRSFDASFSSKNYWGNVDNVDFQKVSDFGVKYIVSDYDINLVSQKVNNGYSKILDSITKSNSLEVSFKPQHENLREIRIFTANFNRKNNCILNFEILEKGSVSMISDRQVPCADIRNYMFYTIPVSLVLNKNNEYILRVKSNGSFNDSISLLGDSNGKPYFELFFENEKNLNDYQLLFKEKNIYLWGVQNVSYVEGVDNYLIKFQTPEKMTIETNSVKNTSMLIKKPYYPGWIAFIDGKEVSINSKNSFISFNLPKGQHIISVVYKPISFYIGIIFSICGFLFVLIYLLRNEKKEKYLEKFNIFWNAYSKKLRKIKWWEHGMVILIGLFVSLIISLFIVHFLPFTFSIPETTAINWYTVHQYPRQQDYYYFYSIFGFTLIGASLFWLFYVWVKNKKNT